MKKLYEKPDAEYIELMVQDMLMNAGILPSIEIGEDDEEGFG